MDVDREGLAWCAGFFDGEGWASSARYNLRTGGITATSQLGIGQAHRDPLDRFQAIMGLGGTVYGPNKRGMYVYKIYGYQHVQVALCRMWPWLGRVKKAQISVVLRDGQAHPSKPKRPLKPEQLQTIWDLHTLGWMNHQIGKELQVPRDTVSGVVNGYYYRWFTPLPLTLERELSILP